MLCIKNNFINRAFTVKPYLQQVLITREILNVFISNLRIQFLGMIVIFSAIFAKFAQKIFNLQAKYLRKKKLFFNKNNYILQTILDMFTIKHTNFVSGM